MADAPDAPAADDAPEKPRRGKGGLIIGLVGALVLGGAGFYATWAGLIDPGALTKHEEAGHGEPEEGGEVAFVPMEPIMISLPPTASARHLRFTGQLEVEPGTDEAVTEVMPRILDVLNT
jgi:flagellar FliL protein